jgi:hypothetical protein
MTERDPVPSEETVSSPSIERRAFVRLASDLVGTCRPSGSSRDVSWPGKVRDISLGGVGLLLQHRFRPGTTLDVDLRDADGHALRTVQVRVVHATPVLEEDRPCWILGCAFDQPLSEEEFETLQ